MTSPVPCPACGKSVSSESGECPQCGADLFPLSDGSGVDMFGSTQVDVMLPVKAQLPRAYLVLESGRFAGRRYPLRESQILGREKCEIILRDERVSRQHAAIKFVEGQFILIDLGSANHTFVNDRMLVQPARLENGDHITLGNTNLRFEIDAEFDSAGRP